MEFRAGTVDDVEAIARLHAESWRVAYRGIYRDAYLDGDVFEDRLSVWEPRLRVPLEHQFLLLACEGDELVGLTYALGHADPRWGTLLDNLHVRRDQQGRGLGRRLMGRTAAWSQAQFPDAPLHLWVLDENAKARRFYEAMGGRAEDSDVHEPPGGGSVKAWRYVWEPVDTLLAFAK